MYRALPSGIVLAAFLAGMASAAFGGEMYRCKNADGALVLQDRPCDGLAPNGADTARGVMPATDVPGASQSSKTANSLDPQTRAEVAPTDSDGGRAEESVFAEEEAAEADELQAQKAEQERQQQELIERLSREAAANAATKPTTPHLSNEEQQYAARVARSEALAKQYQPQLPYGLWPWLPVLLLVLGVLGYVVPFLRNAAREMLDGRERNDPELQLPAPMASLVAYLNLTGWFFRYRGPWWRGGALGMAWILLWVAVLSRTDVFITVFWCSMAAPFLLWSLYRGTQYRFGLFGEYDHYERQLHPELYQDGNDGAYQIPDDAPQRLNQRIFALVFLSALSFVLAWWVMDGSFIENVLFVIFGGLFSVTALMLVAAIFLRLYVLARLRAQ